ncbi:MAG: M24 family metallopeptidase [Bacteroidota bacterium]|jgi:Xaa-Pro aminopeptidase|nr:M24 family metallopeptidase [Cytophagales bacterium]MCE2955675.1 M24 family metallopeptidase [Flammeovirgaceae bacterium]MCZ8070684.1 M24 family metallopeptidase [Cytophagales bacterium]
MRKSLLLCLIIFSNVSLAQYPVILTQREQAKVIDELLEERLRTLLPTLMRREGFDMWVVISREYNEDPVIRTLLPATWFAARRTTMLVVYDKGKDGKGNDLGFEYLAVARYDVGKIFKRAWDPDRNPDQWGQLAKIIEERSPKKIGVNKAPSWGHADGMTSNDYDQLLTVLPKRLYPHVTSAEKLAVAWLETRTEKEMVIYQQICRIAHNIIAEGFSDKVIQPGVTTTEDVVWWYREEIKRLKLDTWFQPSVSIQRNEPEAITSKRPQPLVIMPGDLLHVDFGITYLRLNTDTQQHAYILKPGETDAPEYLKNAFKRGNKLQDILTGNFKEGKTGNQILADSRKQAIDGGITPSIYTHPIGFHGHAAGTTIGMWDMQEGVPFTGDYPMHYNTAYSIELNASVYVIEWKKEIRIQLEEDGYFDETGFRYIDGRQTELIVIPKGIANGK